MTGRRLSLIEIHNGNDNNRKDHLVTGTVRAIGITDAIILSTLSRVTGHYAETPGVFGGQL